MNLRRRESFRVVILGGGPAGLALGYYAKKSGLPFSIYEKSDKVGGNCITLRHGEFRFDSGAHRFHDRDEEITLEIKALLGDQLLRVEAPSQICHDGKVIDFPLSPLNLIRNLGLAASAKAALDLLGARLTTKEPLRNFKSYALHTYGREIAERFLLGYSEKLWGVPCENLSQVIAGKRLRGLDIRTFVTEVFRGRKAKTEHLEGVSFYYPRGGIGAIADFLGMFCGLENIHLDSEVTRVLHDGRRITAVAINGGAPVDVGNSEVVSTLPITQLLSIMEPAPPSKILETGRRLRYRHMILVAVFLNRDSVTKNATLYFPDGQFIFTRIYEAKNRCATMSPPGKTSLVMEIPCQLEDACWTMREERLADLVCGQLFQTSWFERDEVIEKKVYKFKYAYPILETGFEGKMETIMSYLKAFDNLALSGRNGKYVYSWLHDMMRFGKEIIDDLSRKTLGDDETRS